MSITVQIGEYQLVDGALVFVETPRVYPSQTISTPDGDKTWIAGLESSQLPLVPMTKGQGREDGVPEGRVCANCGGLYPVQKLSLVRGKYFCRINECASEAEAKAIQE